MAIETTYSAARENLASLCNAATNDRELVIIHRRKGGDVALIAADELNGLLETAHLLRSPRNAQRLLTALNRARQETVTPQKLDALRADLGLATS